MQAKLRNKQLKVIRCNEIFRGTSYFKNKKDEDYYTNYRHSVSARKTTKSQMLKSEITNVSGSEERPL